MRRITVFVALLCCGWVGIASGDEPRDDGEMDGVRKLFACQIWNRADRASVKVIESAEDYAALQKSVSEVSFPEEGVRRAASKALRDVGDVDFKRHRVVLIWNTSMSDEIRVVKADADAIRVMNVSTDSAAPEGSAQLLALLVARGTAPPRVTWVGGAPRKPPGGLLQRIRPTAVD